MVQQKETQKQRPARDGNSKLSVIDVDVHEMMKSIKDLVPYLEQPWRERIEAPDGWKGIASLPYSWPMIGGVAMADAAVPEGGPAGSSYELAREQLLDKYDIQSAILTSMFHPTDMGVQKEFATALASAYNDWLVENWLQKDDRLRGSVTIAAQAPSSAAAEIDRMGSHPQIVQVVMPASSRHNFGDEFYHPIYEAAQRNDLNVAFHQSYATETAFGLPNYYVEWHTGIFQAWQCQIIGLVCHGVFEKYPRLRVSMLESGWTWLPSLMWRFDYNYSSLRREIPWVKRRPSEYIKDHIRLATQPMEYPDDPQDLYRMFELLGTDEILMFSTDYPHWDFDSPSQVFPKSFPKELREKILYQNASEFYSF